MAGAAIARISRRRANPGAARSNALLFYHLARFVVWGQQHRDKIGSDREFQELLSDATAILASASKPAENADRG